MNTLAHKSELSFFITTTIIKDKAPADGKAVCTIRITVLDDGFNPVAGEAIRVALMGGGLTAGSQVPGGTFYTNGFGSVMLDIIKKEEGEVTAEISLVKDKNIVAIANVEFIPNGGTFRIQSVKNKNRVFSTIGEPTIAWNGATFLITVEGGSESRDNLWKVIKSSAEVRVDGDPNGDGVVTIKNNMREDCIIQCTDPVTRETVEYRFNVRTLVSHTKDYFTAIRSEDIYRNSRLLPEECAELYKQWGRMINVYPGWDLDDDYWTQKKSFGFNVTYNFTNGYEKNTSVIGIWKPTVFRIGA